MSAFLVKRGATMVTKEEARAAVETEIALNLARPMTPAEEDKFCQIANGQLPIQHRPDERDPRVGQAPPRGAHSHFKCCGIFARHSGSLA